MQPNKAPRVLQPFGDVFDRQRRRVAGHYRAGLETGFQRGKNLPLNVEFFDDCLNHHVGAGDVIAVLVEDQARKCGINGPPSSSSAS